MVGIGRIVSLIAILALLLGSYTVAPQLAVASDGGVSKLPPIELPEKDNPKLDSQLNRLVLAKSGGRDAGLAQKSSVELIDNSVRVVVQSLPGQAGAAIRAAGALGTIETSYRNLIQMTVPVDRLTALADEASIGFVRMPYQPALEVVSQGVEIMNADDWHTAGYTGAGVKVAILDVGFQGYDDLLDDELPASVVTRSFRGDENLEVHPHGTACAEVVHDVAPGAELYLVNFQYDTEMGEAVDWLIGEGVNVISNSVTWPVGGPGDGTGPICDIVDTARAAGILWAVSAGNYAQRHWQGDYVDSDANGVHEFVPDVDETNAIYTTGGDLIRASLRWDDPWGASGNDYDLYLLDEDLSEVASSATEQGGTGYPVEYLEYPATYTGFYHLVIAEYNDPDVVNLDLMSWNHELQYQVAAGSLSVPADSPNTVAAGAVPWNSPDTLQPYSSLGPTKDGRTKPDLVATDDVDNATIYPFGGTSAAAPHVAGAAALVKERYPTYYAEEIQAFLEGRAIDLGAEGKDNLYGSGRLNMVGGSIAGDVLQSDGVTPIESAHVCAYEYDTLSGVPVSCGETWTGVDGSYQIPELNTSQYGVLVTADGYAGEWHNNTYDWSEATPVLVVAPDDTTGINFSLESGSPDLIIYDKHEEWVVADESYTVHYTVKNIGTTAALVGHDVALVVDSAEIEQQVVDVVLNPNDSHSGSFSSVVTITDGTDEVMVCADTNEELGELDDNNNCLTNTWWIPGDVDITIQPSEENALVGELFDLVIQAEAGVQPVSGVQAFLDFDPTYLEVQSVTTGSALPNEVLVAYDNTAGTIDYSVGKLGGPFPSGTFTVGTIQFRALAATDPDTAVGFSASLPRETIVDYGGSDITGTISGGTVILQLDSPILLEPAISQNICVGQTFTLDIRTSVDPAQEVDSVQAFIDFDPAYLEVQSVTPSGALTTVVQNTYDNTAGTIDYSAEKPDEPFPSGAFTVASIEFEALAEASSTPVTFSFIGSRQTMVNFEGHVIPGSHSNATVEIIPGVTVDIEVVLEGESRPDEGWAVPVTVKFFTPGADVLTDSPDYEFEVATAKSGDVATCQCSWVMPGVYDITIVSEHTLLNVSRDVNIVVPTTGLSMCTLLEGNADDNDIINISDFGILALSYGKQEGDAGYDAMADFDRNEIIDILDFGLLAVNFMRTSPVDCSG